MSRALSRRFAVLLALFSVSLMLVKANAAEKTRYVEFLGRRVSVAELRTPVFTTDSTFKDYGARSVRKDYGLTGSGTTVCVLDTGADPTHEQLDSKNLHVDRLLDTKQSATFWDFFVPSNDPWYQIKGVYDDHGHGTHVASIAVGDGTGGRQAKRLRGVAPEASLILGKVLNKDGSGSFGHVINGIAWCAEKPEVDVISMSLGSGVYEEDNVLCDAVREAVLTYGKTVVAAAGNAGSGLDTVGSPGICSLTLTVGAATGWTGKFQEGPVLAGFSSRGAPGSTKPNVVAPGVNVNAANACCGTFANGGGYERHSGTSMAAPYVAGTVALVLEAATEVARTPTPTELKVLLRMSSHDAGADSCDTDWGCGLVNTRAAVQRVLGLAEQDIFPAHERFEASTTPGLPWGMELLVGSEVGITITTTASESGDYLAAMLWDGSPGAIVVDTSFCPAGTRIECGNNTRPPGPSWRHQALTLRTPDGPEHRVWVFPSPVNTWSGQPISFVVDVFHG